MQLQIQTQIQTQTHSLMKPMVNSTLGTLENTNSKQPQLIAHAALFF